jgi:hypothetical protein
MPIKNFKQTKKPKIKIKTNGNYKKRRVKIWKMPEGKK